MTEYFIKFVSYVFGTILCFVVPAFFMITHSESVAQDFIQARTVEFVDKGRVTGEITMDSYKEYLGDVYSLGEYNVEMDHYSVKAYPKYNAAMSGYDGYEYEHNIYTIEEIADDVVVDGEHLMKNGDYLTVKVTADPSRLASARFRSFLGMDEAGTKTIVEYGAEVEHD